MKSGINTKNLHKESHDNLVIFSNKKKSEEVSLVEEVVNKNSMESIKLKPSNLNKVSPGQMLSSVLLTPS